MIFIVALVSIPICRLMTRQFIASELIMVQLHSDVILIYFYSIIRFIYYAFYRLKVILIDQVVG
jgi:hypothetical protein